MLPWRHVHALKVPWERQATRALFASPRHPHRRSYATSSSQDIAVLGGGITGLTTAYFLSKKAPHAKITVYEAQPRLGNWLNSTYHDVAQGKALFEHGPRTLRSTSHDICTPLLIQELGLTDEVVFTPKHAPASLNRYIYYPDRLVQLPHPGMDFYEAVWKVLTEPVFSGMMWGAMTEYFKPRRNDINGDESVGSFFTRRLGRGPAQNLISAVLHGIYAGDVDQLSMKSLFPLQWWMEAHYGSVLAGSMDAATQQSALMTKEQLDLRMRLGPQPMDEFHMNLRQSSVYSFKKGIKQLVDALEQKLRDNPNVQFKLGQPVRSLEAVSKPNDRQVFTTVDKIRVYRKGEEVPTEYDQVVSTIFSKDLASLCTSYPSAETYLPTLAQTHATTVMVVNLYYPDPDILPVEGFGYLIPASIPFEQNPMRALGVIFDSDALRGQDDDTGTKVTVMLGGHWWDGWTSYPDKHEAVANARVLLQKHLNIPADMEPEAWQATLQKNCIPQYTVGHNERMRTAHSHLKRHYGGRLRVAGSSYTGVGVKDCIQSAWEVADGVVSGRGSTGLERFEEEPVYVRVKGTVEVAQQV